MSILIRTLPENTVGNDYIVGDLHGCFSLLERLLQEVNFDKSKDRLFSTGDLIDRGPDSLRCLQLLAEPWFYAVQGNHENMMIEFFLPYLISGTLEELDDNSEFFDNGGEWVRLYYQPDQQNMSAEFDQALVMAVNMPLIYRVGDGQNRFHVIHAELVRPNYKKSQQKVWLNDDIDCWFAGQSIPEDVEDRLYWGRTLMSNQLTAFNKAAVQPGLSTTFCGHTITAKPCQLLSHLCIDTGAVFSLMKSNGDYGLTLFDVRASQWLSVSYQREEIIRGHFQSS